MCKVTVIIPYKDNKNYLFKAIDSVLIQSYKKFEIQIIYDNENKTDLNFIKRYVFNKNLDRKFKIKIFVNKKNIGAGRSRNVGIKSSKTKYIAFLDSDDVWHKDKLRLQTIFMKKNNIPISHTAFNIVDKFSKKITQRISKKKLYYKDILKSCDIGLSTVMIDRIFLKKNKFWFPSIKTKEDYVLWLKILKKTGYIMGLNKKLTNYRKLEKSLSSSKILNLVNGYKVYKNYLKMSHFESLIRLTILSLHYLKKNLI